MRDPHRDQPVITGGQPVNKAPAVVVLVHGRGASAEDILGLGYELDLPELAYLAPEAAGNSWDPYSFLAPIEQNEPWLTSALNLLEAVVKRAVLAGIPRSKVAFMGFSQGACLTSEFIARSAGRFGGLVALTGVLSVRRLPASVTRAISVALHASEAQETPIRMSHSKELRSRRRCCRNSAEKLLCDGTRVYHIR